MLIEEILKQMEELLYMVAILIMELYLELLKIKALMDMYLVIGQLILQCQIQLVEVGFLNGGE